MKQFLLTLLAFVALAIPSFADKSGKCGDNVSWTFNESTKALTISGSGPMADYSYSNAPFKSIGATTVIIKEGVTTIGNYIFFSCKSLTSVTIPNYVTSIGNNAFYGCM